MDARLLFRSPLALSEPLQLMYKLFVRAVAQRLVGGKWKGWCMNVSVPKTLSLES